MPDYKSDAWLAASGAVAGVLAQGHCDTKSHEPEGGKIDIQSGGRSSQPSHGEEEKKVEVTEESPSNQQAGNFPK